MDLTLANQTQQTTSILIWSGVLIVVVIVLFFVVNTIRKAATESNEEDGGTPFTLDELRRLHRAGQLSDEEFERARGQIITMLQGAMEMESKPPVADVESEKPSDSSSESPDNDDEADPDRS